MLQSSRTRFFHNVSRHLQVILTSFVLAPAALSSACGGGGEAAGPPGGAPGGGPPAVPVDVAVVALTPVQDASEYVGTLKALRSTSVRPQVDGHIVRIQVRSGDRVRQGTPLLQIDPSRQQAALAAEEATVASREADLTWARQQHERLRDLYEQRVVSKAELDQADTAVKTAEAALAVTRAEVREQRVQLQYYQLTAPTSGIVGDIPARVGDRVTPDSEITTIDSNDQLEIHVPVPSERSTELRNGLTLELLGPDGNILAESTVSFISPRVDTNTQSVLVKGVIRNPGGQLRSQQFVHTRIVWATREGLTVPVLAVSRVSGQPFIFVAEAQNGQQVARQRPVKLGPIVGDSYSVLEGVKPGDRVVVSGVQKLADGVPISF